MSSNITRLLIIALLSIAMLTSCGSQKGSKYPPQGISDNARPEEASTPATDQAQKPSEPVVEDNQGGPLPFFSNTRFTDFSNLSNGTQLPTSYTGKMWSIWRAIENEALLSPIEQLNLDNFGYDVSQDAIYSVKVYFADRGNNEVQMRIAFPHDKNKYYTVRLEKQSSTATLKKKILYLTEETSLLPLWVPGNAPNYVTTPIELSGDIVEKISKEKTSNNASQQLDEGGLEMNIRAIPTEIDPIYYRPGDIYIDYVKGEIRLYVRLSSVGVDRDRIEIFTTPFGGSPKAD